MKQFSPKIYPEWGELIAELPLNKQAEIFNAIIKYPTVEIDSGVWRFIKSQIDRDFEEFDKRCKKNGETSRNYWKQKRYPNDTERYPNDTERYPERERERERERESERESEREEVAASVAPPPSSKTKRACRFENSEYCFDSLPDSFAQEAEKLGFENVAEKEYLNFRDYWISKSGQDATKTNWPATWRNWLRRSSQYGGSGGAAVRTEAVRSDDRPPERRVGTPEWFAAERAKLEAEEKAKRENDA